MGAWTCQWAWSWDLAKCVATWLLTAIGSLAVLKFVGKRAVDAMVERTACKIYEHVVVKNKAASRRELGRGGEILQAGFGFSTVHLFAHGCDATCLRREHVLGPVMRWFVSAALKQLRRPDDGRMVFRSGLYYVKDTEPRTTGGE